VLDAAVGVDVEHVDLRGLAGLRRDGEQRRVLLAGHEDGLAQAAIGAARAALDPQRALDAAEQVLALLEDLQVLAAGREGEARVGDDADRDGLPPVLGGEGDDVGPLGHGHRGRHALGQRGVARRRDLEEVEAAGGRPGDRLDLQQHVGAGELEELALEEAEVQPAERLARQAARTMRMVRVAAS
jgi:hypothetical protein